MQADEERELIECALRGERTAVASLVSKLTPVIQARVARCLLRAGALQRDIRSDVEDYSQEIFLCLFEAGGKVLRSWDPDRGMSLENFVGLVAQRQAQSRLRTGKHNPWREQDFGGIDEPVSTAAGPETEVIQRGDLGALLDRLRESLTPLGWTLFDLLYLKDMSVKEVGMATGMSGDAVYAWRSRLRKQVRTLHADLNQISLPAADAGENGA